MDFYALCAYYWGIERFEAKSRIICWFYTVVTRDMADYIQINPRTLDFIPSEARAEALEFQGIYLGSN